MTPEPVPRAPTAQAGCFITLIHDRVVRLLRGQNLENNWQTSETYRTKDMILKNNLQLKLGIQPSPVLAGW